MDLVMLLKMLAVIGVLWLIYPRSKAKADRADKGNGDPAA